MNIHANVEIWRGSLLAIILIISVITDLRTQKIYNWVTFPGMVCGLILNLVGSGASGVLFGLEGMLVGMTWIILVLLRGSGFGDLKLLMTVGAFIGPVFTGWTILYTAIAGGVMGIGFALRRRVLKHTVKNAVIGAHVFAAVQSADSLNGMVEQSKAGKMAYAPAIAVGVLLTWLLKWHGIH